MEKSMEEEDLKGLEEEIDNAVDRLFVERKRDREETFVMEPPLVQTPSKSSTLESAMTGLETAMAGPVLESPVEAQRVEPSIESLILENSLLDAAVPEPPLNLSASDSTPPVFEPPAKPHPLEPYFTPSNFEATFELGNIDEGNTLSPAPGPSANPAPMPLLKSIDRMEAQLLSLEWEITGEKLEKSREEVLALKELLKQKSDMTSILGSMEKVLDHMMKNEETIRPPWVKFLLDAKETIKLLMRKETEGEISIYKQLAYLGIGSRFSCLEGINDKPKIQPSPKEKTGLSVTGEKKIDEMAKTIHFFTKRVEEIFGTLQQQIVTLEERSQKTTAPVVEPRLPAPPAVNLLICKIDEKLFGVESERVFKLFKVPNSFEEKYSNEQKIRLRNVEVKLIDLKKLLGIQETGPREQIRILTVKENGGYKGFMIDQVLKRVSVLSERMGEADGFFSGVIHSVDRQKEVEIPILDLNKI